MRENKKKVPTACAHNLKNKFNIPNVAENITQSHILVTLAYSRKHNLLLLTTFLLIPITISKRFSFIENSLLDYLPGTGKKLSLNPSPPPKKNTIIFNSPTHTYNNLIMKICDEEFF